jgi:hypothetical protein
MAQVDIFLSSAEERTSLGFFNVLNFVLQYCPTDPSENALMESFTKIGIVPGKPFDADALSPDMRKALQDGMSDAWAEFADFKKIERDTGKLSSADGFGDRAFLNANYMARMSSAVLGIRQLQGGSDISRLLPRRRRPEAEWRPAPHDSLRAGATASRQRVLVIDPLRAAVEPPLRQPIESLSGQFVEFAHTQTRCGRRYHALRPARLTWRRAGVQLAASA